MAKKTSNKKKISSKGSSKTHLPFIDELSWLFYIFISIFVTLSVYTHNNLDASFNRSSDEKVKNLFGKVGSYFSDILFQFFGVAAYIIPVFLIAFLIKKVIMKGKDIILFYALGTIFSVSIISGIISLSEKHNGGVMGKFISLSAKYLNNIGSYFLLSILLIALIILMFHIPIFAIIRFLFFSMIEMIMKFFSMMKSHFDELKEEKIETKESKKLEKEKIKHEKELEKVKLKQEKELEKERAKQEKELEKAKLKQLKELEKAKLKQETLLEKNKLKQETILEKKRIKQEKDLEKLKNSSINKEEKKEELEANQREESFKEKQKDIQEDIEEINSNEENLNEEKSAVDEKSDKLKDIFKEENLNEKPKKKGFGLFNKMKNLSHKDAEDFIIDTPEKQEFVMYTDERVIDDIFAEEDTPPIVNPEDNPVGVGFMPTQNSDNHDSEKKSEKKSEDNSQNSEKKSEKNTNPVGVGFMPTQNSDDNSEKIIKPENVIETEQYVKTEGIEIQVAKSTYEGDNFSKFQEQNKQKNKIYTLPPIQFLKYEKPDTEEVDTDLLNRNAENIKQTLRDFKIENTTIGSIFKGPTLTTYELSIPRGVKISKVTKFSEEMASTLKVPQVRMVPIHEKGVIGVEVPNKKREIVWLKEILNTKEYQKQAKKSKLTVILGKDISGEAIVANLAKMPHLLIAGTTGSGKSVFTNVLVTSILYNATADEVKFILIDPKMLEFSIYNDIPNLLFPVIIDPKKAAYALNWAVDEMERRYGLISEFSERDIISYNKKANKMIDEGLPEEIENKVEELRVIRDEILEDDELSEDEKEREIYEINKRIDGILEKYATPEILPYIVIVLDEYADLMMIASKEVETSIARIAQKARAAGIHLVIATQRPDKDVVTGLIKANLPVRVALSVKGSLNSKIILDETGAEKLLGYGDMLYLGPGTSQLKRIQSPLITSDEQNQILAFLREQGSPTYDLDVLDQYSSEEEDDFPVSEEEKDAKYVDAVKIAVEMKKVSASYLQRRLRLGYNRAARIVEIMEKEGIVGPPNGSKPRELLRIPHEYVG